MGSWWSDKSMSAMAILRQLSAHSPVTQADAGLNYGVGFHPNSPAIEARWCSLDRVPETDDSL
jgi:hypothetical protein